MSRVIERIWARDGFGAIALSPLSMLFGAVTFARNAAYDAELFPSRALGAPSVSVGNLSVGGTGKTPVSAWVAQQLLARGARPAILLRGYGDDEPAVHRELTPDAVVVANPDRIAGAKAAIAGGATVLVLDDGFQHRRARRDVDIVLIAAEQGGLRRLLPAGPLREGPQSLRRAQLLVVTRKTASMAEAERVAADWKARGGVPGLATAVVHLAPGDLTCGSGASAQRQPLSALAGRRILAISAIGAPQAFATQLRAAGAAVDTAVYPDHHAFTEAEARALAARAEGADMALATLKDAVKLRALWPRNGPPFWYLSQALTVEIGASLLTDRLDRLARMASR